MAERSPLTYCSFATDEGCRGVLILDGALDPVEACKQAWRMDLNPGGDVMVMVTDDQVSQRDYERLFENRNRLLAPHEARELLNAKPVKEWEAMGKL